MIDVCTSIDSVIPIITLMRLYTSIKRAMILTPHLVKELHDLEKEYAGVDESGRRKMSLNHGVDRKLARLESLQEINHDMEFSDNLQWILARARENSDKFIISFDADDDLFMDSPATTAQDDEGNEILLWTLSAETFGKFARTSRESEGGQNVVFQDFKKNEQSKEPQKSEGFWNKVEGLFNRGWNK